MDVSEGPVCLFLFWGKHTPVSWNECPTVTVTTLARTADSDADSCYIAHVIFNLLSQLMQLFKGMMPKAEQFSEAYV